MIKTCGWNVLFFSWRPMWKVTAGSACLTLDNKKFSVHLQFYLLKYTSVNWPEVKLGNICLVLLQSPLVMQTACAAATYLLKLQI